MNNHLFKKALIIPAILTVLLYGCTPSEISSSSASPSVSAAVSSASSDSHTRKNVTDDNGNSFTVGDVSGIYEIDGTNYVPRSSELRSQLNFKYEFQIVPNSQTAVSAWLTATGKYGKIQTQDIHAAIWMTYDILNHQIKDKKLTGEDVGIVNNPFAPLTDAQWIEFFEEFKEYFN
jgi:hypothetical protein